jgi:hypothetical protein
MSDTPAEPTEQTPTEEQVPDELGRENPADVREQDEEALPEPEQRE